ncbi:MAG: GSCFA domain-containing protein [Prevotella sp.]|nr:GSCFA domain-containing protein [Prevotella sp.]
MNTELFRTVVDIEPAAFQIQAAERILCVGSCFADEIGRRLRDDHFPTIVNPFGVMYNPASILHTIEKLKSDKAEELRSTSTVILTLGTNHVYIEKATGEIVDNCQKRPQQLFEEQCLSVDECADYLNRSIKLLREMNPQVRIILTVSPIRYRKYGYHGSQLSKATLLLAVEECISKATLPTFYFPAYELLNDELRDYRFYSEDMLHPSEQAVDFIYRRFQEVLFSEEAKQFAEEWRPIREALAHRPFHPESAEYQAFIAKANQQQQSFEAKWKLNQP